MLVSFPDAIAQLPVQFTAGCFHVSFDWVFRERFLMRGIITLRFQQCHSSRPTWSLVKGHNHKFIFLFAGIAKLINCFVVGKNIKSVSPSFLCIQDGFQRLHWTPGQQGSTVIKSLNEINVWVIWRILEQSPPLCLTYIAINGEEIRPGVGFIVQSWS